MYVPVAVDDLLQEKVQSGELPLKYLDQYRFIISHIVFERMTDKRYEEEGSYVRMNMDTLRRHISQDYAYRFRDALIAWKIIECNGVYSKREHTSFGYRLTEAFRGGRFVAMNVGDPSLIPIAFDRVRAFNFLDRRQTGKRNSFARWCGD